MPWGVAAAAVGAGISAAASGGGSSPSGYTTNQQTQTPINQAQTVDALNTADRLQAQGSLTPYYPGQTYAGLNGQQTGAIGNIYGLGTSGSSALNQANNTLTSMAQGGATNPFLDATYNQAAQKVQGSLNGQFNASGRLGSGAQFFDTSQGLNNLATDIYGGQYNNDQNRALQASSLAPANYQAQLTGGQAAYNAAGQLQNDQQQQINANVNRYNSTSELSALKNYEDLINGAGNGGGSSTQSTPYYTNNTANTLGYASLGSNFGGALQSGYNYLANQYNTNAASNAVTGYQDSGLYNDPAFYG